MRTRSKGPEMRLARVAGAAALVGLLALTPSMVDYARHELTAQSELEALTLKLPERTVVLATTSEVGRAGGECQLLVASVLGSELPVAAVAEFAAGAEPRRAEATRVAWAEPGTFRHRAVRATEADRAPIPPAIERQLSRWLALPPGVRRVVVYRTEVLSPGADPRCSWPAT